MRDKDILTLAVLVLKPEELEECFLRAFHRLPPEQREAVEDVGLEVMTRLNVTPPEALEVVAHAAIYTNVRRVACSPQ